ncbi:MAG: hypothetical protein ACT4OO_15025 [Nitrospiraceae bacterium]
MKRICLFLVTPLFACYLVSSVQATLCLDHRSGRPADHHHAPHNAGPCTLCGWACQAYDDAGLQDVVTFNTPPQIVSTVDLLFFIPVSRPGRQFRARPPPRPTL